MSEQLNEVSEVTFMEVEEVAGGSYLEEVPEHIQGHIREITKTSGLEDSEESVEKIAQGWIEKNKVFKAQIEAMDMEEVDSLDKESADGALALTYSGSLVNIGPLKEDGRTVEYSSIGLRADVPESAEAEGSVLKGDVNADAGIEFERGPVQATSPIYKIAVCKGDLDADTQEEKINNVTMVLKDEFVNVNKTIILD